MMTGTRRSSRGIDQGWWLCYNSFGKQEGPLSKKRIPRQPQYTEASGGIGISLIPVPLRIDTVSRELSELSAYPDEKLATIISEVGFHCILCGKCCTRVFNGHVFLLDRDATAIKAIDPDALEPAPFPEFCDQHGMFYVSGYALRAQDDEAGSCWFLSEGRCRIYDKRFTICRIYPYMLHREPDEQGKVDWRQFSGIDEHGEYHTGIPRDTCSAAAADTKEYELAYLRQEMAFLEYIRDYFARNRLRHVQKIYDDRMRAYTKGEEIRVMVYSGGRLEEHRICKG